jgi:putative endonuclease
MHTNSTRSIGSNSEQAAVDFLVQEGYEIVQRNFYCPHGELDIIARKAGELAFIEVKSIILQPEISIYELLQPHKLLRLQRSIDYWLVANNLLNYSWHFEFIALTLNEDYEVVGIEHIPHPEL